MPREVVERDKLVRVIDDFLRPFTTEEEGSEDKIPQAAVEYLARAASKKPDTVARALQRIKKGNTSGFVGFETAEWIVAVGMGRPDLFYTDLKIITNGNGNGSSKQLPAPKKRPPVPPDVPAKRCSGPLCRGQQRPLGEFYFYKSGRDAGKYTSYCKECSNIAARKHRQAWNERHPNYYKEHYAKRAPKQRMHKGWQYSGYVAYSEIEFAVEELCKIFGVVRTAAKIGIHRSTLRMWRSHKIKKICKERAAWVLRTLQEVRNGNGSMK